ncbi:MAG: neutral/alkaline non-lysosomal ceramidase N-terminal domain-containing protein [Candidatus Hydrogenedentes bacterium]|nr:neutral/alkaline non-lysosomal ceramidase N-terminal domain-containing protein [Candidatus Hydrogenedentota bacterium]
MTFSSRAVGGLLLAGMLAAVPARAEGFKVGVARSVITPAQDMWMAGYASRTEPSQGKLHDLFAKALAIEDEHGDKSIIVTTDLIGLPANISKEVAALVNQRFGIPRERLMLTSSHTHSGPVVRDNLFDMYGLSEDQVKLIEAYTLALPGLMVAAVEQALNSLEPCILQWGIGEAGFAKNRRKYTVDGVINDMNPIGPVDHDVPVLAARREDGSLKAVLFGYACHNTTLSLQQFCGDYAGFAQAKLEERLPGTTALYVEGCGGDQNPLPRRTIELAQQYGDELATAVEKVLNATVSEVRGPLRAAYKEIPLALSAPPTREQLEQQLQSQDVYVQRRAKRLLATLDEKGALDTTYPYPVQVWQFADSLQMTVLGGEATVDYSLRLKYELGRDRQFVIAYANDVCAYIPSLRVLREGGYEGESSMVYYGFYGPWAPSVEEDIVAAVHELSKGREVASAK